jgi:hypothetical protein
MLKTIKEQVLDRLNSYYRPDELRSLIIHTSYSQALFKPVIYVYPIAYGDDLDWREMDKYSYLTVIGNEVVRDVNNMFGMGYKFE